MDQPLWTPSPERITDARLTAFLEHVSRAYGRPRLRSASFGAAGPLTSYEPLFRFSIDHPAQFWTAVWDFCGIVASTRGERVIEHPERMPGAHFFPDARLNFAENLLRRVDDSPALIFRNEQAPSRMLTRRALYDEVSRFASALRAARVAPGDRVAGYMPNVPETIVAALGAAAVGAIWSSSSPDFGVRGVLDRFGQIAPTVLVAADGYLYGGRRFDILDRVADVARQLPSLERTVVVPQQGGTADLPRVAGAITWDDFLAPHRPGTIEFAQLPFDHPLYIMYSSGTTGAPKCIVHGAGGTLIQHLKEHQLHCDIHPGDRVFYFTTCGWMMWNWLVSALASDASLLLYDGSPFYPNGNVLFDFADEAGMTLFGTSAKYIDAVNKAGLEPARTHRLEALRTMTSTGSPLAPESFDFVYRGIKRDLHLASISGGTDIISCFVGGNPAAPVWRGEIQARALGMAVDVFDENGRPVREEKGELVCTAPFPSMPVEFCNDASGAKYRAAYFEKFPGVWAHGDYAEITRHDGVIIYGRSDAVLNPGGVRIGTAEIYRQVEQLDEVLESLVVGQKWENDERVVLFVRLRDGTALDSALKQKIREAIRRNATPRHVPAKIVQVGDIPRTKSGKITELAVRDVIHGRPVKNREALANPDALDLFADIPELDT